MSSKENAKQLELPGMPPNQPSVSFESETAAQELRSLTGKVATLHYFNVLLLAWQCEDVQSGSDTHETGEAMLSAYSATETLTRSMCDRLKTLTRFCKASSKTSKELQSLEHRIEALFKEIYDTVP